MTSDPHERDAVGRKVPEWRGSTPDAKIPDVVKARIFRCYDGRCYRTGIKLRPGEYDFDHIKPLADGGEHSESNLAPIWRPEHRLKTAAENSDRKKADRIFRKNKGLWPKSKRPLKGRGFSPSRKEMKNG